MNAPVPASWLQALLDMHHVTGASVAWVHQGGVEVTAAGTKDVGTGAPVDTHTLFDAASLTKPLVAHAVLQLVDAGALDLDEPLAAMRTLVPGDARGDRITLRHLLSHTAGLQNLRGQEPLRLFFKPGARFSYSSVGFMVLQRVLEARTGEPLETAVRRLVFEPLGMQASSLALRDARGGNEALPHQDGQRLQPHRAPAANASYSLRTTAGDYGAFVAAVLRGTGLREGTWREWLAPAVVAPRAAIVQLEAERAATDPGLAWGLGWGLEPGAGTFFQWGKMDGTRAFAMGSVAAATGVVLLTNSNTGLRLMDDVVARALPGEHPALRWLREGVTE